ncbi:MAG: hypothetical protein KF878_29030 [Planctomycetes bacterium]|nr:hypothetical protein [Planctomycetota bacterium]
MPIEMSKVFPDPKKGGPAAKKGDPARPAPGPSIYDLARPAPAGPEARRAGGNGV